MQVIILQDQQLYHVLQQLEQYHPKSLQLEVQIRNHLKGQYDWPGVEFVVDEYPDFSVIWSRPIKGSKEYVPRTRMNAVSLFCKDIAALEKVSSKPDFVDWSQQVVFAGVDKDQVFEVLTRRCREHGCPRKPPEEDEDRFAIVFFLEPDRMENMGPLPTGLDFGTLSVEHAEQVNSEWKYGTEESLRYFQFLLRNHFPSVAIFEASSHIIVAYILYSGDGSLGTAYVKPEYRRKGLFQQVCRQAALKVREMGQEKIWVYVDSSNDASLNAFAKMGAQKLDWKVDWLTFKPPLPLEKS